MFGKEYKYFVSYAFQSTINSGNGMCDISSDKPIERYADIVEIAQHLENKNNFEGVVILNYKKIK